jgi:mycothiol synthase
VNLELPAGVSARAGAADDIDAVLALVTAAEEHYDGMAEVDRSDIETDFGRVGFDPAVDGVLVLDGDDAVGWADLYRGRAEADVRPSHHRRGIGAALLTWTERRAREIGSESVWQTVTDHNGDGRALFLANGYEPSGTAWILEIAFDELLPEHPTPEGISIRAYDPERDATTAHEMIDAAFTEWDGREPMPFEEWARFIIRQPAFSAELSRLAFDGDELVGATLAFDYPATDEGWVQQVATKATHRHRGIARALLHETFRAFADRGKTRCGLSTESRTGALSLYERVGMHVRRSYTKYEKSLT